MSGKLQEGRLLLDQQQVEFENRLAADKAAYAKESENLQSSLRNIQESCVLALSRLPPCLPASSSCKLSAVHTTVRTPTCHDSCHSPVAFV